MFAERRRSEVGVGFASPTPLLCAVLVDSWQQEPEQRGLFLR